MKALAAFLASCPQECKKIPYNAAIDNAEIGHALLVGGSWRDCASNSRKPLHNERQDLHQYFEMSAISVHDMICLR